MKNRFFPTSPKLTLLIATLLFTTSGFAIGPPPKVVDPIQISYYLTQGSYDGNEVLNACAAGYHMANLWEMLGFSNLVYNTEIGYTTADSGQGPVLLWGWVRTGMTANSDVNCGAWTTDSGGWDGLVVVPDVYRVLAGELPLKAEQHGCSSHRPVWCVSDAAY